eukprot:3938181-Rhodomonas_salina.3
MAEADRQLQKVRARMKVRVEDRGVVTCRVGGQAIAREGAVEVQLSGRSSGAASSRGAYRYSFPLRLCLVLAISASY